VHELGTGKVVTVIEAAMLEAGGVFCCEVKRWMGLIFSSCIWHHLHLLLLWLLLLLQAGSDASDSCNRGSYFGVDAAAARPRGAHPGAQVPERTEIRRTLGKWKRQCPFVGVGVHQVA
jgi:hypothetical protein